MYAGFNLILFSPLWNDQKLLSFEAMLVTNSGGGGLIKSRFLDEGERYLGSVSNGIDGVDAKEWPKVKMIEKLWADTLGERSSSNRLRDEDALVGRLFEILA